jgi:hypothetical protein
MRVIWILLLLILPLPTIAADDQDSEGDEKILETIRKIQEEEEEEEGDYYSDEDDDDDCSGCDLLLNGCLELLDSGLAEIIWQYLFSLRFAPYPYATGVEYNFSFFEYQGFAEQQVTSVQLSADLSNHLDGTYGNTNRLTAQLSALHLNVFNQTIFATSESLSAVSVSGGLSLFIGNFDLSGFAGMYLLTTTGTFMFSTGLSSRIFLPANLYLDVYNVNAFLNGKVRFVHLLASLNYSIWRFSIGAGYNYNSIVGDIYTGPCLKVSFWL